MCNSYTCVSAKSSILCKTHSYWSLARPNTKFQCSPSSRSPDTENGCARAPVQLYPPGTAARVHYVPNINFCKMLRLLVSNHIPNFSAIRPVVSEKRKRCAHVRTRVRHQSKKLNETKIFLGSGGLECGT